MNGSNGNGNARNFDHLLPDNYYNVPANGFHQEINIHVHHLPVIIEEEEVGEVEEEVEVEVGGGGEGTTTAAVVYDEGGEGDQEGNLGVEVGERVHGGTLFGGGAAAGVDLGFTEVEEQGEVEGAAGDLIVEVEEVDLEVEEEEVEVEVEEDDQEVVLEVEEAEEVELEVLGGGGGRGEVGVGDGGDGGGRGSEIELEAIRPQVQQQALVQQRPLQVQAPSGGARTGDRWRRLANLVILLAVIGSFGLGVFSMVKWVIHHDATTTYPFATQNSTLRQFS